MPDRITARAAAQARGRVGPKSLAELLDRFGQTPEMRHQRPETARQVHRLGKRVAERFGRLSIPEIERPDFRSRVYDWRDEMAATPAECERTIRFLSRCIGWGVDRGLVQENRIEAMRFRWLGSPRLRADIVWTPQQFELIRPHIGPIADAFEIAVWTGLRQGDVIDLRQDALDHAGWLRVVPQKTAVSTGIMVQLPTYALPPLAALMNRLRARDREYILPVRWSTRLFRRRFERAKHAAGLGGHDLHWHDIRGTVVTWLLEAGCTEAETAAVMGHVPAKGMRKRYAAQSRVYSEHAFQKLHAYMQENLPEFYSASLAAARR